MLSSPACLPRGPSGFESAPRSVPDSAGDLACGVSAAQAARYRARDVHRREFAMQVLESDSQAGCGVDRVPLMGKLVEVLQDVETSRGHLCGIKRCGSVWTCPVCAYAICATRGRELQRAIERHRAAGGEVAMLTVTLPHRAGDRLPVVYGVMTETWAYVNAGAPSQRWREKMGVVGLVRGVDATHGRNGWHPHIHAVVFFERAVDGALLDAFQAWLLERWSRKIAAYYYTDAGALACRPMGRALPADHVPAFGECSPEHAIRLTREKSDAGYYISKLGLGREVTRLDVKVASDEHRTPFRILEDYRKHRRPEDRRLWSEWGLAMKGKRHLFWSPGLRARLDLLPEQLDLELAEAPPPESRRMVYIDGRLWDLLAHLPGVDLEWCILSHVPAGIESVKAALVTLLQERSRSPPEYLPLGWRGYGLRHADGVLWLVE